MSQENVEVVRAVYETWNAGDMDAFRELFHPEAIMRIGGGLAGAGAVLRSRGVMRECGQLRGAWDADALEVISDFIDIADHVVLRFIWRGAGYNPEANMEFTGLWTVRKGRIFFVEFFWDHAEALEAVGLSEQDAHPDS
jgi:ketosteroid isomerase-like protein